MLVTDTLLYKAKDKERVYYKEVYSEWTQPVFNANNFNHVSGNYVLTASHQANPAWYAFNASNTGDNCWWTDHGTTTETNFCWICFYSTKKMKFNSVTIKNETKSPVNFKTGVLQGSQDGQTWVDLCALTGQNTTALEMTFDFENDIGYYYYRCYFTASFGAGVSIQWIKFYGTQHTDTIVSTPSDYDYFTEVNFLGSLPLPVKRRYYKRLWRTWDYTPALTSNTSDPNFIVSADTWYTYKGGGYYPWRSFAASKDYIYPWISADKATGWYQIQTTSKLRIHHIEHRNRKYDGNTGSAKDFDLFGSLDGTNWELIGSFHNEIASNGGYWITEVNSTKAYYYHKFVINSHNQSTAWCSLGFPTIYADEEYGKIETTVDDYDFYEDEPADLGAVTYPELKYFKRGTEPNLRLRGTPDIVDGVFSNITAATASILPRNSYHPGTQEWEWGFKVTTGSDIVNQHLIVQAAKGFTEATRYGTRLYVENNYFVFCVSYNGTAWDYIYESDPAAVSAFPIQTNTTYWVKLHHKDGVYTLYVSTDGVTYELYHQKGLGKYVYNNSTAWVVGAYNNGSYTSLWNGSIDLKEAYIKFGDEVVWRGTHPVECSEEEAEWSEWINIDKPIN